MKIELKTRNTTRVGPRRSRWRCSQAKKKKSMEIRHDLGELKGKLFINDELTKYRKKKDRKVRTMLSENLY